ncbi:MAG: AMP-binding protein [Streptosporangiaceae bacterium]|nr:AMP-binding protein [Streptosporangiaceae bacterium]
MAAELLELLDREGAAIAIQDGDVPGGQISRRNMVAEIAAFAGTVSPAWHSGPPGSAWVAARDRCLQVMAVLGCLACGPTALPERTGPPQMFDTLAGVCPPALVVSDDGDCDVARWAAARGVPVHLIRGAPGERIPAARSRGPVADSALQLFTSGTTGPVKCVSLRVPQLLAATAGVAGRLVLTESDTSLSIAPLTHTLGFVTSVLAGLLAGGRVAFADPQRANALLRTVSAARPTWCAASPSGLRLLHTIMSSGEATWPGLRFLRSSSAPLSDDLAAVLEGFFQVPVINAYVMTEAPGEIASQDLAGERRRGTVGRPTLCEVEVRSPDAGTAAGEIWIRGPNVAVADHTDPDHDGPGHGLWTRTGDIGAFDDAGFLRVTGRTHDVINQGGVKVWPPEVEAAALQHPDVTAAVAFPIPHEGLGETVGLVVVPREGRAVDRTAVRRLLMADLPRDKWPSTIVVRGEVPLTARGKVSRRRMWQMLGVEAR